MAKHALGPVRRMALATAATGTLVLARPTAASFAGGHDSANHHGDHCSWHDHGSNGSGDDHGPNGHRNHHSTNGFGSGSSRVK
jgi:hypothetical protein